MKEGDLVRERATGRFGTVTWEDPVSGFFDVAFFDDGQSDWFAVHRFPSDYEVVSAVDGLASLA